MKFYNYIFVNNSLQKKTLHNSASLCMGSLLLGPAAGMSSGSAFDGIRTMRLALPLAATLPRRPGDRGPRSAHCAFTGGQINGSSEAPEVIYRKEQNGYYPFIAYDWLQTKHNVRVGCADSPQGPFLDFEGCDWEKKRHPLHWPRQQRHGRMSRGKGSKKMEDSRLGSCLASLCTSLKRAAHHSVGSPL
jgi:hypothetical protein